MLWQTFYEHKICICFSVYYVLCHGKKIMLQDIIFLLQSWLFVCRGHGGLVMRRSLTSRWSRHWWHLHWQPKSFRRTSRIGTYLLLRQSCVSKPENQITHIHIIIIITIDQNHQNVSYVEGAILAIFWRENSNMNSARLISIWMLIIWMEWLILYCY